MKEFGGCLYLEMFTRYCREGEYYKRYKSNKVDVDSGRSAIQYILESNKYKRIWLPVYNCPLVFQRIKRISNIEIRWYNLNEDFTPQIADKNIRKGDLLLWVNYCGVMFNEVINHVVQIKENTETEIIIDNIPAYFSEPRMEVINIYSCRKFLGVSDGGHIIGSDIEPISLPTYSTSENYIYLLQAIESGSNSVYEHYKRSERRFCEANIAYGMPVLTQRLLQNLDYTSIKNVRKNNFDLLHKLLGKKNRLHFNVETNTPSVYPYLTNDIKLRQKLLEKRVYISRFWKHVLTNELANNFEKDLAEYLIPLPIDQRYSLDDMQEMVEIIESMED